MPEGVKAPEPLEHTPKGLKILNRSRDDVLGGFRKIAAPRQDPSTPKERNA